MAKVINITDKLSKDKPIIKIGDREYEVNDSLETVMKFDELHEQGNAEALKKAFAVALGKKAVDEINFDKISMKNIKVYTIALMAAMQGLEYEEAEARFRDQG